MAENIHNPALRRFRDIGMMLNTMAVESPSSAGEAAFRLFCTPQKLPVSETDVAFLTTARLSGFHIEGLTIRSYLWESSTPNAPTVLFLHGWESNAARWYKFVRAALEAGFRVQAFDAPASGNSEGQLLNVLLYSRTIKEFLDKSGAPFAIVAHSLGAAAAVMSLALLDTKRPQKMVIIASFAESSRVLRDFAQIVGANESVLQALFQHIERQSGLAVEDYSVSKKAAELTDIDGFVLHDFYDEVAPVSEGLAIAESWGCRFLETRGFGHRMQDKIVVEEVIKFLKA